MEKQNSHPKRSKIIKAIVYWKGLSFIVWFKKDNNIVNILNYNCNDMVVAEDTFIIASEEDVMESESITEMLRKHIEQGKYRQFFPSLSLKLNGVNLKVHDTSYSLEVNNKMYKFKSEGNITEEEASFITEACRNDFDKLWRVMLVLWHNSNGLNQEPNE